jgi:hypothetical protein
MSGINPLNALGIPTLLPKAEMSETGNPRTGTGTKVEMAASPQFLQEKFA